MVYHFKIREKKSIHFRNKQKIITSSDIEIQNKKNNLKQLFQVFLRIETHGNENVAITGKSGNVWKLSEHNWLNLSYNIYKEMLNQFQFYMFFS